MLEICVVWHMDRCSYFQVLLNLWGFFAVRMHWSLPCAFPCWMLCVRCVFSRGDAYVTVQLPITSIVLIKFLILIFKEVQKISIIIIVSQYLSQLGYFTLQFTEKPAPKLLNNGGFIFSLIRNHKLYFSLQDC